jgi:hypothetical protein
MGDKGKKITSNSTSDLEIISIQSLDSIKIQPSPLDGDQWSEYIFALEIG